MPFGTIEALALLFHCFFVALRCALLPIIPRSRGRCLALGLVAETAAARLACVESDRKSGFLSARPSELPGFGVVVLLTYREAPSGYNGAKTRPARGGRRREGVCESSDACQRNIRARRYGDVLLCPFQQPAAFARVSGFNIGFNAAPHDQITAHTHETGCSLNSLPLGQDWWV